MAPVNVRWTWPHVETPLVQIVYQTWLRATRLLT
jgi:hypothetical protein